MSTFLLQAASISALALQLVHFPPFNIPTTPVLATPVCTSILAIVDDGYFSAVLNSIASSGFDESLFSIQLLLILSFALRSIFVLKRILRSRCKKKLKNKAAYQDFFHYVLVGFM
jgi:hypothetical protein